MENFIIDVTGDGSHKVRGAHWQVKAWYDANGEILSTPSWHVIASPTREYFEAEQNGTRPPRRSLAQCVNEVEARALLVEIAREMGCIEVAFLLAGIRKGVSSD